MQCQVVTNSECSNYRHCFQSEIAQFPRMRSPWWEKKKKKKAQPDRDKRQSSLCGVLWLILSVCLSVCACMCVSACTCASMLPYRKKKRKKKKKLICQCADCGITHSITAPPDKSRNGSCQPLQHLAPQLSPSFTARPALM